MPTGVHPIKDKDDLDYAVKLTHDEHWYYTHIEIGRMLELDPEGSFVFEDRGKRLGFITTVSYGRTGVIGQLIVSHDARRRKIGETLLKEAVEYLEGRGVESIMLYSSGDGQKLYSRHGFTVRQQALVLHTRLEKSHIAARGRVADPMTPKDLPNVIEMDNELFGDDRSRVMKIIYRDYPRGAFKLERDGHLVGFIMGRPDHVGYDLGPWACVSKDPRDAEALFDSLLPVLGQGVLYIGTFPENDHAVRLFTRIPKTFELPVPLMVKGKDRYPGSEKVYAVAAMELG
jgi:ribosomal protein S18 acetylase RimI-like enzyme